MPDNHNAILPMFSPMVETPKQRYKTVVADPPWDYRSAGVGNFSRKGAGGQYPCMQVEEILQLPVGNWADDNSQLYLWVPNSFIVAAHRIAESWGFRPRTLITWVKGRIEAGRLVQHVGLGYTFRSATEHVVFATRGEAPTKSNKYTTVFVAPRTSHSAKPDTFYDIVEHMSPGPYLDVFSRAQRFNWDTFGNEAFNFGTELPPERFTGVHP